MIREVKFESQDRRIKQILACLNSHGIASIEEANEICDAAGIDPYKTCEETQMICFDIMMKPMYELPGRTDIECVTVTAAFVRGEEDIKIELK